MEDFLFEYYGIHDAIISSEKDFFPIIYHDNHYCLYVIDSIPQIEFQYSISHMISNYDSFVLNKYHSIYSVYYDKKYVLLKKRGIPFYQLIPIPYREHYITLKWKQLWILRANAISSYDFIKNRYPIINDSIDYYLGLLELSISLLDSFDQYYYPSYISHDHFTIDQYYNPLTIKIDVKERDFGEYLKYLFFHDMVSKQEIITMIYENRYFYDYSLVLARILYPNYYFDLVDEILADHCNETCLNEILLQREKFKEYYSFLEEEFSKYCKIKKVLL